MRIICGVVFSTIAQLLCLHAAAGTTTAGAAPSQLVVRVVDATGAPVSGARVSVYVRGHRQTRSGFTDPSGIQVFADLDPGSYLVDVEAPGFATRDATPVTLEAGTSHDLSLTLSVGGFQTQVVVTASDAPERRSDVSKAVSVVDRQEIEARDLYTVGDAMRAVPGAHVEQFGGPGVQTSIRLRGLRSQDTAVLIDGVPFRDLSATQGDATSFISDLLVTNVDRVEVLRGSGSDLYGSNAVGGAVNVILRPGGGPTRGEALIEGGNLGLVRARGQIGGGLADGRFSYSGGVTGIDVTHGVAGGERAWNTTLQGSAAARIGGATVSALVHGARAFSAVNAMPADIGASDPTGTLAAVPLAPDQIARYQAGTPVQHLDIASATFIPSTTDPDSTRRSGSSVVLLQAADQVADRVGCSVSYRRVSTTRRFSDGPAGAGFQPAGTSRWDFDGGIDTVAVRSDVRLGSRQTVTGAYQVERERYRSLSIPGDPAPRSSVAVVQWNQTASIQHRLQILNGSLHLAGGLRVQFFSLRRPQLAPAEGVPYQGVTVRSPSAARTADASAEYLVSATNTRLRIHAGSGYREPSLYERFGTSFDLRGYSIYGDPWLEPERSLGVDAGVDQELAGGHTQLSASVFTTSLDRVIVFDSSGGISPVTDPFGRTSGYRTLPGGRASGLELWTRTEVASRLTLTGSYTLNARSLGEGEADPALIFGLPRHQASVQAVSRANTRLQVAALLTVATPYLAPLPDAVTFMSRSYRFGGVRRLDLSASYTLPLGARRGMRVLGRVDNVTNGVHFESGFRTPGRAAALGVAAQF